MKRVSGLTGYSEHALVTRRLSGNGRLRSSDGARAGMNPARALWNWPVLAGAGFIPAQKPVVGQAPRGTGSAAPWAALFTFLGLMLLSLPLIRSDAMAQGPHKVLVIHSYHQEFPWTQGTDRSFRETLGASGLDIEYHTEYLDTKRTDRDASFREMEAVFARKFSGLVFDLIFVSDNDALDFILPRRDVLCPHAPIVFSGINRFSPELIRGQERITGVAEKTEMAGTVELALRLHPEARRVVGISDDLTSARLHMEQFKAVAPQYHGRLEFIDLSGLSTEELLDALKKLPRDSIVLHFSFFRDREGRQYSLRESVELVTASSPAPVYTLWDWKVDWGVVGGEVASSAMQGKLAAELAVRILNGESAENMPVILNQTTVPMVSYPAMARQGIPENRLPPGTVVLDRPYSFFRTYRYFVLGSCLLFALQLIVISMLLLSILRRRRAEHALRESEGKYRTIFENAMEGLFRSTPDGRFVSVSPSLARIYGYDSPEELIASVEDIASEIYIHPEDRARFVEEIGEHDVISGFEHEARRKDGSTVWVSVSARPVRNENRELVSIEGFVLDVTERKNAELEMRRQTALFRNLFEGSPEAIAIVDHEDRVLELNRSFETLFGYSETEARDRYINDLVARGPCLEDAAGVSEDVVVGGRIVEKEAVRTTRDRGEIDVSLIGYPIVVDGRQIGAYAIYRDIGDRKRTEKELRESQSRLSKTTENVPGLIYQFQMRPDGSTCFPYASTWCSQMFGIPPETIREDSAPLLDLIFAEDRPGFDESIELSARTLEPWRWEGRLRSLRGDIVWHQGISMPERQPDGSILWSGVLFDITERKTMEKSLQQEQEFIRALLENMVDGVVACDAEGRLVLFNRTARDWHGVDPSGIPQEEWASHYSLFAEDGRTPLTVATIPLARAYRGERLRDAPLVIKAKHQPARYVTSHCAPFYDSAGQLLGAMAVMRDLTEARRTQLALQESEERFRQVVESSPMPIGIADTSGRIDYINPRFRETFGYSLGEIDGLDQWFTKAYPDAAYREAMRDQWTEVLKEAAREQRPSAVMDVHVTCRDGSVRIMEVFGAVVGGRVIAVFNDLTERVRSEAALRESVAEKESLLREVHHRVKNNLQIINSLLQLQARKVQNEDVHALFRDTQNRVRSMALLHETLYRSGNVARVSLLQYVREVCRHIARSYGTVPGLIELRQEVADVMLDLDLAIPAGLIVSELVTNAFKHAFPFRSEGEIIVAVQNVDEKHLALRVSDNGVGLRADADPEDAETLGLLLVRSLTRQLDGQMTIYRENGTLFEIVFPVPGS